jgi:predicted nucleotidyltransferase
MFSPAERGQLRDALVRLARADERITGAALTGSAARDAEDRWSDIDLAFGIADGTDPGPVVADWTGRMYADHGAVHHFDVTSGAALYRVFLLASTLQVDLAFAPAAAFRATAPTFRLLFGTAATPAMPAAPAAAELIGLGWLYALHARSSIERGRVWQAEYMISGVRDQAMALACLRHDLPAVQGRGMDSLPPAVTAAMTGALVRSAEVAELARAFAVAAEGLLAEAALAEPGLAARLAGPVRELAGRGAADQGLRCGHAPRAGSRPG